MTQILDELMGIEEACSKSFNKKDVQAILKYFSDDISGFSSTSHDRFQGKTELGKTFEYYLSEAETVSYELFDPTVSQFGDTAILSFYWRVTLKSGNKRFEIPGRGTHVFHKISGEWQIIHEHFSRAH
jgi:ketosteroid isomerase-like protein